MNPEHQTFVELRESEMKFRRENGYLGKKPVWVMCDFCDAVIKQNPEKGRVKKTCSDVCRNWLWVGKDHPGAAEAQKSLRQQNAGTPEDIYRAKREIEQEAGVRNDQLEAARKHRQRLAREAKKAEKDGQTALWGQ